MSTIKQDRKDFEMLLNGIVPVTDSSNSVLNPQPAQNTSPNCVDNANPAGFAPEKMFEFDYDSTKKMLRKKARKSLNNILKHILPDSLLEEEYIKDKMEQDIDTMSDLYMQLEITNVMQRSLVDNVSRGNTAPRNYEVFGQLSEKIQALNKQIVTTEQTIRKTYIDLKLEIRDRESDAFDSHMLEHGPEQTNKGIIISSSRQLIEMAQKHHKETYGGQEAEFQEC